MSVIASIAHRQFDIHEFAREARKFPILSEKEELALSRRYRDTGDMKASDALASSHLRLVIAEAMKLRKFGFDTKELVSEGNIGLMTAIKKFDPEKGNRLSTYALWWIKAAVNEYMFANRSSIKISNTSRNKKIIRLLVALGRKAQIEGTSMYSDEALQKVADAAGASLEDVRTISMLYMPEKSMNAPVSAGDEETATEFGDLIADNSDDPETLVIKQNEQESRSKMLRNALNTLTEREKAIFVARRLQDDPETLEELAIRFDISRERIRQIEVKAFEKIEEAIKREAANTRWAIQDRRFNHSQGSNRGAQKVPATTAAWQAKGGAESQTLAYSA